MRRTWWRAFLGTISCRSRTVRSLAPWAVTAACLAGAPAAAQPADVLPLTLEDAVARALATSEEVDAARARQALAEGQITQVRAGALPQLRANLGYTRTLASIFDNITLPFPELENGNGLGALPFGRPNVWNTTFQFSQPLYAGGRVRTALDVARYVRRAAALEIDEAEADIALQVRRAYFQVAISEDLVIIVREAYDLADAQLRQVELFRQQGTASDFDVLRARVERDNLEPPIIEARNARRLAELELKRLINVPPGQPIQVATRLDPVLADVDERVLREALDRRAALQALDQVIAAREGAVRIARSARLPSVDASGTFSFQAFPNTPSPVPADWRRDWAVSVNVSLPILDGRRAAGETQQAEAELWQARLQRAQLREGIELEFEAALGEFEAARAQIAARRATVGQARRALELAELRFRTGLATQLEISDARLLLRQAQVNETQALSAFLTTLARLERASGGGVALLEPRLGGTR
jgi:outer membrane protein